MCGAKTVTVPAKIRKIADKGQSRAFSIRSLSRIMREAVNMPAFSGELFKFISKTNVFRTTRFRFLKTVGKLKYINQKPPLSKRHIQNHLKWVDDGNVDFSTLLFTYKTHATFDRPNSWNDWWVLNGRGHCQRLRRQQSGEVAH